MSIKLLRSAVFVVLVYPVGKVSIKLLRSGSFLSILSTKKVSIELPRSAVLSTQKCVHRTAKVRSSMDTFKNCHIWQDFPSVLVYVKLIIERMFHFSTQLLFISPRVLFFISIYIFDSVLSLNGLVWFCAVQL